MDNQTVMHPGIKLRHIRVFLDIAAEGSLSAVARAQGITQPAVSRSLAELETLLGQPMFHRQGRRMVLTEAGALFRAHASTGVQALEAGAAALRSGTGGGALKVGVLPTAATRLLPRVVLRLREIAPDLVLSVTTGPHSWLMRLLREGAIDVMVGRMPASDEMADLSFDHLYEEDIVLAARHGHPLAGLSASDVLARVAVVLPPRDAIIRRPVDDYLASVGRAGMTPAAETVALAVGRGIVLGSDAVWFISRGVILDELERGEMVVIPATARYLSGAVGVTRRQGQPARPGLEVLVQVTREAVRQGRHR